MVAFTRVWRSLVVGLVISTPSLAAAFDFATSQTIDGQSVTCSSVNNTATYTQCNDLLVDGLYFPNGITCGPEWSTTNSSYSDTAGFCESLTGSSQIEVFYTCDISQARATWFDNTWGTTNDNGFTQHLRCFRGKASTAPVLGLPALVAMAALLLVAGVRRLTLTRSSRA